MRTRILSEIRRPLLTTQGDSAIATAVSAYRPERFSFKQKRNITFATVASEEFYTTTDHASLGLVEKIDYVHLIVSSQPFLLRKGDIEEMERRSVSETQTGQPTEYVWHQEQLRLWPVPTSSSWTIRVAGNFHVASPASDVEASNPWMLEPVATLIRCRAKYELAAHVLLDDTMAARYHPELPGSPTFDALRQLRSHHTLLTGSGIIEPMMM